ncbi:heparan sulfate 2-O-sulfotransferase pipe isoform X2 [Planococcus citri]|uniref:heparan sulfate 2-O-sulfotransferase pipe isoform X2 n=1 Tax=Planococcus citri TaxID=170843 RepID=UPI0031F8AC3B
MLRMDSCFSSRRGGLIKRSSEFVALIAIFATFFLLLHTRDLHSRLKEMENKLQPDELSGPPSMVTGESGVSSVTSIMLQLAESGQMVSDAYSLNNTRKSLKDMMFFNRVPKVGSQTFMELLRRLSMVHKFEFYRDKMQRLETIRLPPPEQLGLASMIDNYQAPGVFIKHVCHINFSSFDLPDPIYINVVRDPVERVISWYYYVRAPWYYVERKQAFPDLPLPDPMWLKKDYETCVTSHDKECQYNQGVTKEGIGDHRRQSMFFCGHSEDCTPFNSAEAVEKAKRVVDEQYAVVGVLEDMNITLTVLEHYIPRFFKGAADIYYSHMEEFRRINKNIYKPPVGEEIKDIVRKNFTREIEFYQFCRQRLHKQFLALKLP